MRKLILLSIMIVVMIASVQAQHYKDNKNRKNRNTKIRGTRIRKSTKEEKKKRISITNTINRSIKETKNIGDIPKKVKRKTESIGINLKKKLL